jgi:hypothetical protein
MNNFNSKKKSLEFFKQTPIHDWSFLGYDSYSKANNDRLARKTAIKSRFRACLNDLSLIKDMKEEGKQKVLELVSSRVLFLPFEKTGIFILQYNFHSSRKTKPKETTHLQGKPSSTTMVQWEPKESSQVVHSAYKVEKEQQQILQKAALKRKGTWVNLFLFPIRIVS